MRKLLKISASLRCRSFLARAVSVESSWLSDIRCVNDFGMHLVAAELESVLALCL